MNSEHLQLFYELSPFRPEWVAYVPRTAWAFMQIVASAAGVIILLKHKEYEHVSLPLGPFAILVWIRRGNRLVGPITAYNLVTWLVFSFAGLILSATFLDGLTVAAHPSMEPRPIATLLTCGFSALLYKNLVLKAHIHAEAEKTTKAVPTAEINFDEVTAVFAELAGKAARKRR